MGAWCDQRRDLLDERSSQAACLRAPPGALPPHQPDPDLAMRHVVQDPPPAAAARGYDPAVRAALQLPRRRDRHRHRRFGPLDRLDMDRRQAEQHVTAGARVSSGGRVGAPRSVGQRRGPRGRSVVGASDHRGPRPLHPARHAARATPYRIDEEPPKASAPKVPQSRKSRVTPIFYAHHGWVRVSRTLCFCYENHRRWVDVRRRRQHRQLHTTQSGELQCRLACEMRGLN